ncbi:YchJ family protein [Gilvimarinus sp. DA14]|uniref:YchJ family protein n=1 Tax=Gilvimarinus sp. DA14 TaxID=2956798 RepID=UPI0020B85506|nr:YchJ family metal-binding protein [Gilvimarinus sp. DA14]UTF61483.1 YchJ family metal-binding protein [Gilvimarinus sp. DA14]
MPLTAPINCPCGSGNATADCCGPLIFEGQSAPTAERLMRSRYTAHVVQAIDYLWQTWSVSSRNRTSKEAIDDWARSCHWLGLDILACEGGGADDDTGTVTFSARYQLGQQTHHHLEKSLFRRESGHWRYIDHCG